MTEELSPLLWTEEDVEKIAKKARKFIRNQSALEEYLTQAYVEQMSFKW